MISIGLCLPILVVYISCLGVCIGRIEKKIDKIRSEDYYLLPRNKTKGGDFNPDSSAGIRLTSGNTDGKDNKW